MSELARRFIGLLIAFAALTAFYWVIARFWPSVRGQKILRNGFFTDSLYWLWTPIVTKAVTPVAIAIAVLPLLAAPIFPWRAAVAVPRRASFIDPARLVVVRSAASSERHRREADPGRAADRAGI